MNRGLPTSVFWSVSGLLVSRGATMFFTLLLARFVLPEAFGQIALVLIAVELARALVQAGLVEALIQRENTTNVDFNTAFTASLVFGTTAYVLLWLLAPLVEAVFGSPGITPLLRATGASVILYGFPVVQIAHLRRQMHFAPEMKAQSIAAVGSGLVAIGMAVLGLGVWSLVAQLLLQASISTILIYVSSTWRPSFQFSLESFRQLFGFGRFITLDSLVTLTVQNSYILAIGLLFSAQVTGYYFVALRLVDFLAQRLTGAIQQAAFPEFSHYQADRTALRDRVRKVLMATMTLLPLVLGLLLVHAGPLVEIVFNEEWRGAVPFIQVLSIGGVIYPIHAFNVATTAALGRSDILFRIGLLKQAINISLMIIAIPFGLLAIVASQVLGSIIAVIPNSRYPQQALGYGIASQLVDTWKPLGAAFVACVSSYLLRLAIPMDNPIALMIALAWGLIVYLAVGLAARLEGIGLLLRPLNSSLKALLARNRRGRCQ